jgi:hypothetical protein
LVVVRAEFTLASPVNTASVACAAWVATNPRRTANANFNEVDFIRFTPKAANAKGAHSRTIQNAT